MKSNFSVALLAMSIMCGLTGCATGSSAPGASSQLYQPRVLALPAGRPIQTANGIYTPQAAEIWHSPAEFQKLERQVIDLSAALEQERQRK
ncbi:MAG: hypothetical protein HZA93_24185 [Verrucomicrobia bacterium]|nr:hypothetical protein [Verrucomicrobiota bacterium]